MNENVPVWQVEQVEVLSDLPDSERREARPSQSAGGQQSPLYVYSLHYYSSSLQY
jgi:hypothetical protein